MFRYLVLGLLRIRSPRHGYALMKEYEARSGLRISSGTFYRELQRLASEGLVRVAGTSPDVDRRRAPYTITNKGIAILENWLAHPTGNAGGAHHDELFARITLLGDADPVNMERGLIRWRQELRLLATDLERSVTTQSAGRAGGSAKRALSLMVERRLQHLLVDLKLIDELVEVCNQRGAAKVSGANVPASTPSTSASAARQQRRAALHRAGGARHARATTAAPESAISEHYSALRD